MVRLVTRMPGNPLQRQAEGDLALQGRQPCLLFLYIARPRYQPTTFAHEDDFRPGSRFQTSAPDRPPSYERRLGFSGQGRGGAYQPGELQHGGLLRAGVGVQIFGGGFEVGVTQQFLDGADVPLKYRDRLCISRRDGAPASLEHNVATGCPRSRPGFENGDSYPSPRHRWPLIVSLRHRDLHQPALTMSGQPLLRRAE